MGNRMKKTGAIVLGYAVMLSIFIASKGCDAQPFPERVFVQTPPGSIALVPYDRQLTNSRINVMPPIRAKVTSNPEYLPHDIRILESNVWFSQSRAYGDIILMIPQAARGSFSFTVTASAVGRSLSGGRSAILMSEPVTAEVLVTEDAPRPSALPALQGIWVEERQGSRRAALSWDFAGGGSSPMTVLNRDGRSAQYLYWLRPSSEGDWIIQLKPEDSFESKLYRISMRSGSLAVGHAEAGPFDPFAVLRPSAGALTDTDDVKLSGPVTVVMRPDGDVEFKGRSIPLEDVGAELARGMQSYSNPEVILLSSKEVPTRHLVAVMDQLRARGIRVQFGHQEE